MRFYRYFMIIVIFILVFGCAKEKADVNIELGDAEPTLDLDSAELVDFGLSDAAAVETDTDSDGMPDKFTYIFEKTEVADGLYLQRSIEYSLTDEGYDGEVVMEFTGDGSYEHVEYFPKSFASSIDDIEFSVPPDEVISDDPAAKWLIENIQGRVTRITARAKNKGVEQGSGAAIGTGIVEGFDQLGKLVRGEKYDFSLVGRKAVASAKKEGGQAAVDAILDNLDEIVVINDFSVCARKTGFELELCLMQLMYKNPSYFKAEDCGKIFDDSIDDARYASCRAILRRDIEECRSLLKRGSPIAANRPSGAELANSCILNVLLASCSDPKIDKNECATRLAKEYKTDVFCSLIKDKMPKAICNAEVTQDGSHCETLVDKAACCSKIMDEAAKNECLGVDDGPAEETEEEPVEEVAPELLKLQNTNILSAQFCAYATREIDDNGKKSSKDEMRCIDFFSDVPLMWNGRLFSANSEKDVTDSFGQVTHHTYEIEGSVSEDGTKLVRLTLFKEYKRLPYDHRYSRVALTELEFDKDSWGMYRTEVNMKSSDVKFHVTDPEDYQLQENDDGKRWEYRNMVSFDYGNADNVPLIKVKFEHRDNWFPE